MTPPADDTIVRQVDDLVTSWHELRERHARATGALERALEEEHQLGVSEYEVLERLADADDASCRMQALHDTVHLSQSALSRVVGLYRREGDADHRDVQAVEEQDTAQHDEDRPEAAVPACDGGGVWGGHAPIHYMHLHPLPLHSM